MNDVYTALRADLLSRLPPGAAVRLSGRGESLFVTDIARRQPCARPPEALWEMCDEGGLWFFRPAWAQVHALCHSQPLPGPFPTGPAGAFASLLYRYREEGEADGDFTLLLLRTLGLARLGRGAAVLLPPLKASYARGLAEGRRVRTPETALIALETALILEGEKAWISL